MDLGQCTKFHTEEFKRQFEENLQDFIYYENLLEKELLGYLQEADKKIKVCYSFHIIQIDCIAC